LYWDDTLELLGNALTIVVSLVAVFYWVRLFKGISITGKSDRGWLWVFMAVLMTLLLNVSSMFLAIGSGGIFGVERLVILDSRTLGLFAIVTRAAMAILLAIGAHILHRGIDARTGKKYVFAPVEPKIEDLSAGKSRHELMPGESYLIGGRLSDGDGTNSHRHEDGIDVFADILKHGRMGFAATRRMPEKIRQEYGLLKTPMVWLTREHSIPDSIQPTELTDLSHIIKELIRKEAGIVVLLEGVEYLILYNTFNDVLKVIQGIDDVVSMNNATFIVTLDPSAITEQQYHLLSRELTVYNPKINGTS